MTAETPRVGDTVRMTSDRGDVVTTITGPVKANGPVSDPERLLTVGGIRCDPAPEGWTVEVIERALPPEPPIGSIVAEPGKRPLIRWHDGLWWCFGRRPRIHLGRNRQRQPRHPPKGVGHVTPAEMLAQVAIVTNHARAVADDPTACDGARTLAEAVVLAMDVLTDVLADRPVPLAPVMPLPTRIVPGPRLTVGDVWASNDGGGRDG